MDPMNDHSLTVPTYNWYVEILPDVTVHMQTRPPIWRRLWFRLFFGWTFLPDDTDQKEPLTWETQ